MQSRGGRVWAGNIYLASGSERFDDDYKEVDVSDSGERNDTLEYETMNAHVSDCLLESGGRKDIRCLKIVF